MVEASAAETQPTGFTLENIPLQHIMLFLPWIQKELPKEKISRLYEKFGMTNEQRDKLIDSMAIKDDDDHVRDIFNAYYELFSDLKIARRITKWFIEETNNSMANRILFSDMNAAAFQIYLEEFLNNPRRNDIVFKIVANFPIVEMEDNLRRNVTDPMYRKIAEDAKTLYSKGSLTCMWRARCIFLIDFISSPPKSRKPENWFDEFLSACSYNPRTRVYAYYIDHNYQARLNEYRVKLALETAAPKEFTADLVSAEQPLSARPQSEFLKPTGPVEKPSYVTGEISLSNYTLYKYQEELSGQAKDGKNCIICAPTGSGKTLVAVDIIADHLRKKKVFKEVGRCVLFVPTIPLAEQQYNYAKEKIGTEFFITKMSGDERAKSSNDRLTDILAGDIIVMTPQMFINMLLSPLKSQKIYLTDFTLMLFDECHNCGGDHAYNVVMDYVRNAEKRPQIVGLTASTGSGKPKGGKINPEDTLKHITGLCARLMAVTISSVKSKENIEDLKSRIPTPVDEFLTVPPPRDDKFASEIAAICDFIEKAMEKDVKSLQQAIPALTDDQIRFPKESEAFNKNGSTKTSIAYYSKLSWIRSEIEKRLHEMKDKRLFVLKYLALLDMLYYTLKYNELFPAELAMNYLKNRLEQFDADDLFRGREDNCILSPQQLQQLRDLFQSVSNRVEGTNQHLQASESKPILQKLIEILCNETPTSRIIIFVDMRKVGDELSRYLNKRPEIVNLYGKGKVGYIASTNQASTRFGQSQADQQVTLQKFKNGSYNILVATSVAEEGLDVAACNLVIKYNSVGSEKSLTQRKGRARAKNSKAILLALEEKTMRREFENVQKEILMNICIQALQKMSDHELTQRIREQFEHLKGESEKEKRTEAGMKERYHDNIYELLCKECSRIFCKSDECFCLNSKEVVCCNIDCWDGTTIRRKSDTKNKEDKIAIQCGEWLCPCGYKRGTVLKYGGTYLPTISDSAFIYQKIGGQPETNLRNTTWKIIRDTAFTTPPITTKELHEMAASLFKYNNDMYKEAEEYANFAVLDAQKDDKKQLYRKNYSLKD